MTCSSHIFRTNVSLFFSSSPMQTLPSLGLKSCPIFCLNCEICFLHATRGVNAMQAPITLFYFPPVIRVSSQEEKICGKMIQSNGAPLLNNRSGMCVPRCTIFFCLYTHAFLCGVLSEVHLKALDPVIDSTWWGRGLGLDVSVGFRAKTSLQKLRFLQLCSPNPSNPQHIDFSLRIPVSDFVPGFQLKKSLTCVPVEGTFDR